MCVCRCVCHWPQREAEAARCAGGACGAAVASWERHRRIHAREDAQQRRLPHAVDADQALLRAARKQDVDAAKLVLLAVEGLRQFATLQQHLLRTTLLLHASRRG
jgi:hypothetical protein